MVIASTSEHLLAITVHMYCLRPLLRTIFFNWTYHTMGVVLSLEGIDLSNLSWDEENNAELDVLKAALNYTHAVRNRILWQVGRFLVHSSFCLGMSRNEVSLFLGKRVFQKRRESNEQLLLLVAATCLYWLFRDHTLEVIISVRSTHVHASSTLGMRIQEPALCCACLGWWRDLDLPIICCAFLMLLYL